MATTSSATEVPIMLLFRVSHSPKAQKSLRYSPSSSSQSGMWKPTDSSLDRSSAEWTGRGAMGPSAFA